MSNNNNRKEGLKGYCRIRGFTTELLLLIKKNEPITTRELSLLTGKSSKLIYVYLYRLRKYGYVEYKYGYWLINKKISGELEALEKPPDELYSIEISRKELSENACKILYTLLNNYANSGGRKYMLFQTPYDVEETFKLYGEELRNALIELLNKGIIYYVKTKGLIKIGLMKNYVETLLRNVSKFGNNTNTTTTKNKNVENP
ncbi:MAG: hypothetical protein ABIK73_07895 [candidate division WOR-3 bacterium]